MSTDKDFWVITLAVIVTVAGIGVALATLWYMIKYSIASTSYWRTRDATTWRKTVRKSARKAALVTSILMFIAIESCWALVFLELMDFTPVRLTSATVFGILASTLAGVYILVHARWQDLMNKVLDWQQKRHRDQDSEENSN